MVLIVNRHEMIDRIGKEYLTTNIEAGEYSYVQEASSKEKLEKAIDENFMSRQHGDIWKVAQTPEEAVQLLYEIPVWDISIRKFAAI